MSSKQRATARGEEGAGAKKEKSTLVKMDQSTSKLSLFSSTPKPKIRKVSVFIPSLDDSSDEELEVKVFDGQNTVYMSKKLVGHMIKTTDIVMNETVMVDPEALFYNGIQYQESDIARTWKKDCRTWLWKNSKKGSGPGSNQN